MICCSSLRELNPRVGESFSLWKAALSSPHTDTAAFKKLHIDIIHATHYYLLIRTKVTYCKCKEDINVNVQFFYINNLKIFIKNTNVSREILPLSMKV